MKMKKTSDNMFISGLIALLFAISILVWVMKELGGIAAVVLGITSFILFCLSIYCFFTSGKTCIKEKIANTLIKKKRLPFVWGGVIEAPTKIKFVFFDKEDKGDILEKIVLDDDIVI